MSWFTRLRNALSPRSLDRDLDDEMRDHLERRIAALESSGLTREQAIQKARIRFGNQTQVIERSREARLSQFVESTVQDLLYASRLIRKQPGFTATIVVSLALAIGANTAVFSILDAALLQPLPVSEPDRLIAITSPGIQPSGSDPEPERESFSYPQFRTYRKAVEGSARLGLFSYVGPAEVQSTEPDSPIEHASRQHVSGDAFGLLGVTPALGRLIDPRDDTTPGTHPVIVLGYRYWQSRFHADPAVIGRQWIVEGVRSTIIGVARQGFFGVEPGRIVDVWLPAMEYNKNSFEEAGWSWFQILGRLGPGVSPQQIQSMLQPAFHDFNESMLKRFPTIPPSIRKQFVDAKITVRVAPAGLSRFRSSYAKPLWILLGVALAILAIACSNVASMLLARAASRASEVAMRVSLGAGKLRLIRQLLTESLLYSLTAGLLGWAIAKALSPLLVSALSTSTESVEFLLSLNTNVLAFSLAVSILAAVVFGLAPAWQASRSQPIQVMRTSSGQSGKLHLGRLFVSAQVAFAFGLLIFAAAFLFSLRNLAHVNMGFRAHGITTFNIRQGRPPSVLDHAGKDDLSDEAKLQLMEQLRSTLLALPGVTEVSGARWSIFTGASWTEQVIVPGKTPGETEEIFYPVSEGYFKTLGSALIAGRDFVRTDSLRKEDTPAIVNLAFASRYFPGLDPIGQHFRYPSAKIPCTIVGVVENSHYENLRRGSDPIAYFPFGGSPDMVLYVRSAAPVTFESLDRAARATRPDLRVSQVFRLESLVNDSILRERLIAVSGGTLGALGLVMAAIGLFGLLSYSVERRTREIGIRSALGARRTQIVKLVLRETFALVAFGLAVGFAAAEFVLTSLQKLLYGISPMDPAVALTACGVFLIAALVAAGLPARRAATVDPMSALRIE